MCVQLRSLYKVLWLYAVSKQCLYTHLNTRCKHINARLYIHTLFCTHSYTHCHPHKNTVHSASSICTYIHKWSMHTCDTVCAHIQVPSIPTFEDVSKLGMIDVPNIQEINKAVVDKVRQPWPLSQVKK